MQIQGKRIVITGAASDIGRALLMEFAGFDVEIIAADHDVSRLRESIQSPQDMHASINPFVCDLSTQAGTDELFDHALAVMNGIDIFIAAAGLAYYEHLDYADWDHIESIYRVNVLSTLYTINRMWEFNPDNPYMTVVTASTMAHWGIPGYALYSSTKGALERFRDAYRFELPRHGRLMFVYPIGVRTHHTPPANVKQVFPLLPAEKIARAIRRGIERDAQTVYPSRLWVIGQMVNRVVPLVKPLVQRTYQRILRKWERAM